MWIDSQVLPPVEFNATGHQLFFLDGAAKGHFVGVAGQKGSGFKVFKTPILTHEQVVGCRFCINKSVNLSLPLVLPMR